MSYHLSNSQKEEDVAFWAHKFEQHFQFISTFLVKNEAKIAGKVDVDRLLQEAYRFEREWADIARASSPLEELDERPALIKQTLLFKQHIKQLFKSAGIPCLPDLLEHMQEELMYFEQAIYYEQWSFLDELAWWAREHAENLDFVNCELPQLVKLNKINIAAVPFLVKAFAQNKLLSNKFKSIEKLAEKLSQGDAKESELRKLYQDMMNSKMMHLKGVSELIQNVDSLPITEEDKVNVYQMLTHERSEAEFSLHRLNRA